jgi:hypothetical protein
MGKKQKSNREYGVIGRGLLLILWGITILFDLIPFGLGLLGTSLILLGMNVVRSRNGLPARGNNTLLGILTFVWGILELARPILLPLFRSADLDWAIFAILLIVLGIVLLVPDPPRIRKTDSNEFH